MKNNSIHNDKILWLASYPKSGNTWFRAFLTALMKDGELDINDMETAGIFSSRQLFEQVTDIDSYSVSEKEAKNMMPDVFRSFVENRKELSIIKVHDAYSRNADEEPIIPKDVTLCAIYIVRNPLDVVSSLANHLHKTKDEAIAMMNSEKAFMGNKPDEGYAGVQFSQLLYSWSSHALSWLERPEFPVHVIKYEDMHSRPFEIFKDTVEKIGLDYSDESIRQAIEASSFNKLQQQEEEKGFKESPYKDNSFFRKGITDGWKEELTEEQAKKITNKNMLVMKKFGYL